jgi:hypothetical protein
MRLSLIKFLVNVGLLVLWAAISSHVDGWTAVFWVSLLVVYAWYYDNIWNYVGNRRKKGGSHLSDLW